MKNTGIATIARTPIGRACKGGFHPLQSPPLLGHVLQHAARNAALAAGYFEVQA